MIHNGIKFFLINNGYYRACVRINGVATTLQLHREIWKTHHGDIPPNHDIHHIDGDKTNNNIENLQCLSKSEHGKIHGNERFANGQLSFLRDMTLERMATPEGMDAHRKACSAGWKTRKKVKKTCQLCSKTFNTKITHAKYCSKQCLGKASDRLRYCGSLDLPTYEKKCKHCSSPFSSKNSKRAYCSNSCKTLFYYKNAKPLPKSRKCKICEAKFVPISNVNNYCGPKCRLVYQHQKREERVKKY